MASIKSPISILQEISSTKLGKYPIYKFEKIGEQEFKCMVELNEFKAEAKASNKKTAKTVAADILLRLLGIKQDAAIANQHLQYPVISSNSDEPRLVDLNSGGCKCQTVERAGQLKTLNEASPQAILEELKLKNSVASSSKRTDDVSIKRPSESPVFGVSKSSRIQQDELNSFSGNLSSCSSYGTPDEMDSFFPSKSTRQNKAYDDSVLDLSNKLNLSDSCSNSLMSHEKNPVSFLEEKMASLNEVPSYELINVVDFDTSSQTYYFEVTAQGLSSIGSGSSKREAKCNAAISLLSQLRYQYDEPPSQVNVNENSIGKLQTYCQTKCINKLPVYKVVAEKGEAHKKTFIMKCTVGSFSVEQSASSKQIAKHLCAKKMLELLEKADQENQVNEIKIESKILDDNINEKAWNCLQETRVRDTINVYHSIEKVPLKDYLNLFENNSYGNSDTLMLLKLSEKAEIYEISNPKNVFKSIVSELSIHYELATTPSKAGFVVNLLLKCHPNWSFMETSSSLDEAQRKVFISALEFLFIM